MEQKFGKTFIKAGHLLLMATLAFASCSSDEPR